MKTVILVDFTISTNFDEQYWLDMLRKLDNHVLLPYGLAPSMCGDSKGLAALCDLSPESALDFACDFATEIEAPLMYVAAPLQVPSPVVAGLRARLAEDQMFGVAMPRFSTAAIDLVWTLPQTTVAAEPKLTRRALAALPERWIMPELLSGCMLIRKELATNPPVNGEYKTLLGSLLHLFCSARRRGFRTIVDNRICISTEASRNILYPEINTEDSQLFHDTVYTHFSYPVSDADGGYFDNTFPAEDKAQEWYAEHDCHRLEALCVAAHPPRNKKRSIVVDCRGMMAFFCGTTVSQLGFLQGFEEFTDEWDIHVLAQDFAFQAHDLRNRFPKLTFSEELYGEYACVVHMNQPCFAGILRDLHKHGFLTAGNILDTICWDMILGAPPEAQRVWDFSANYLDLIFYISNFSRQQFNRRFPVDKSVAEVVTHLSVAIEENTADSCDSGVEGDYILVFGNSYDHKDVFPTVQRLRSIVPEHRIVALGPTCSNSDNVEFLQSGSLPDCTIEELFSQARAVVFPSWVEGFGMPVVKALAYGRNVIVRAMPLWREIAANCDLPGHLYEFYDFRSLGSAVAKVLGSDNGHPELVQGNNVKTAPVRWKDCSQRILDGIEKCLRYANSSQWIRRERLFRFIP